MTVSEIFAAMPPALAGDILEFNHANEKRVYRTVIETIAQGRRVRPVFIERLPRAEQHGLLLDCLGRPQFHLAADALLRTWLLKKHPAVLADFLDALGIKHDQGAVDDLPATVEDAALKEAIEKLLAKHARDVVAVYLAAFNAINVENWANLDVILKEDERLHLKPGA